jgi:hypothetical protein
MSANLWGSFRPNPHKIVILSGAPTHIVRVPQRWAARSRRTSTTLICSCCSGLFNPQSPNNGTAAIRTNGRGYILSYAVTIFHQRVFVLGMIVRSCFFERLGPNVFVTFKLEQALAAMGAVKPSPVASGLSCITRRYGDGCRG